MSTRKSTVPNTPASPIGNAARIRGFQIRGSGSSRGRAIFPNTSEIAITNATAAPAR